MKDMKKITNKKAHEILQYILQKAGCKIVCYIGRYVRVKHVDSDQYGTLLSIDSNHSWLTTNLENKCYNPRKREKLLLEWMLSESAAGKKIVVYLDNHRIHMVLKDHVCLESLAIEADMNSII